ncbi:MAG: glycosyltransferase [Deltaproteobacteria bacterium]|nr:glycosyltransferase [Deltaproteobacteria bacterium]
MTTKVASPNYIHDRAHHEYSSARRARWDQIAGRSPGMTAWNRLYHQRLSEVYRWLIPKGRRVLEVGCGIGDLLGDLDPEVGVGVDFSSAMLAMARTRHPKLKFIEADALQLRIGETFDFIVLSDLVNDLWDVQGALERLRPVCHAGTRVVINVYSHLWEIPLRVAQSVGAAKPLLAQNWLTVNDMTNLLHLAGFEVVRRWEEMLCPLPVPAVARLSNLVLVKSWPFKLLAQTNFIVARPAPYIKPPTSDPTVSVVIPARNESENIEEIFRRVPDMGKSTELVFVEGHSKDETYDAIQRGIDAHPERKCLLLRQTGEGKADAVRLGFERCSGNILMILDADLTVAPEDLPRFVEALRTGQGEFINGVRLVYPMESKAMRFFNLLGNKFFSSVFSWLLGQPIKDTLCGTKALWKADYARIVEGRSYFGNFDPFGDFELLFGASKLTRRIVEMPVRYRQRVYGETNIRRWTHGWLLLKMSAFAARRMKWV